MMDLRDAFDDLAGRPAAPTGRQVDADLARGRGALRKRRVMQTAGGSLFAVAAAVGAFAVFTAGPATGPAGTTAQKPPAAAQSIKLVAYEGKQPEGFTVDTVPDGWFIQNINEYELVIAPDKAKKPGPKVDPSKSPVYDPEMYVDKIAVFLSSKDEGEPDGKKIKVGDREGVLRKSPRGDVTGPDGKPSPEPARADGDYGTSVFVKQSDGVYVITQFWGGLNFSEQQMIELAAGVRANKGAVQGVG